MKIETQTVAVLDNGRVIPLKQHHIDLVKSMCREMDGHRHAVEAIKFMRAEYSLNLKDAKDICEWYSTEFTGNPFQNQFGN